MKQHPRSLRSPPAPGVVGTDKANGNAAAAPQSAASVYGRWFDLMPALFGAIEPQMATPRAAPTDTAAASQAATDKSETPFPVGSIVEALLRTQQMLAPLYQGYAQALAAGSAAQSLPDGLDSSVGGQARQLMELFAPFGQGMTAWPLSAIDHSGGWTDALTRLSQAAAPVMAGAERTFGGLTDALGLAPSRELSDAQRALGAAALERQQAQAEYLAVIAKIWSAGAQNLRARLSEMAGRGESVDSLSALIRLWAKAADEAAHAAMQSDEGLSASTKMLRAGLRHRKAANRLVAVASEAMNVPTRAEVDEAYRHIQELKRELRRLRKSVAALERGSRPPTMPKGTRK